ncbi:MULTISPECIES: hypothetical protein [Bacillus cereus group]|nr:MULTISPECIES: hypothetical protein [Bacillus cereus group]QUG99328.1 hypothetical protein HCM98_31445 [Bacillus tropicus]
MKYVKLKFTHGDSCHHIKGPGVGVGVGSKSAHGNTGGSPIKEHGKGI